MTRFQIILLGVFGVFIIGGILVFSVYKGNSKEAANVLVWGTIPKTTFDHVIQKTSLYQSKEYNVSYVEKSEESFDRDFVEALASGKGPDVFMLPSGKILKHYNKIFIIPYTVFTERQFKDAFIEGAEIYMAPEGTVALPVYTDPLVMYWNRSMFTAAQLTEPPKYWDEFYNLASLMTNKDGALNISKSAVAFGEYANVTHAKDILIDLAIQSGTPVTVWGNQQVRSVLMESFGKPTVPAEAAVNFYTEFSNPAKSSYSWNRSLPESVDYFLSGDLGLYFGFASEAGTLQFKNPNLNFDAASVPSSRESGVNASLAQFQALAITKATRVPAAAFAVVSVLTGPEGAKAWSEALKLPPARRALLAQKPGDALLNVFWTSAIRARGWLDPSPGDTDDIFKDMIESITSGRARVGEALSKANTELSELLFK